MKLRRAAIIGLVAVAALTLTKLPAANAEPTLSLRAVPSEPPVVSIHALPDAAPGAQEQHLEKSWRGLGANCSYLAPKSFKDGAVDVVFHFHAGQLTEREVRESGLDAVFVSCGFGLGSGAYSEAFADSGRFGRMLATILKDVKGVRVRHVALASWSAGFAAVAKILAVPRYYDMVDAVVLNDSLHSVYLEPNPHTAQQGIEHVDVKGMATFVRFAKDATLRHKAMVMTHSAIIPPDYASSTEATRALLAAIDVPTVDAAPATTIEARDKRTMTVAYSADAGDLHVQGFKGRGPRDHFDHLHLLGGILRDHVVPRWKQADARAYTLASGGD